MTKRDDMYYRSWLQNLRYDPNDIVHSAETAARRFFSDIYDLAGKPYITHLERVADRVAFCDDDVIAVAWLHDLIEDTAVTLEQMADAGWPDHIVQALDAITQRKNEPLESYWTRVAGNRIAWIIKLHGDMPDNNDPSRRVLGAHKNNKIGSKYARAIDFFWSFQNSKFPEETIPCGPNV